MIGRMIAETTEKKRERENLCVKKLIEGIMEHLFDEETFGIAELTI